MERLIEYQYQKIKGMSGKLKSHDGGVWSYIPLKTFLEKENYNEGIIFGDVSGKAGGESPMLISMHQGEEKKTMSVQRSRSKLSFFDKVPGYIMAVSPRGQEGYVRIVKKSLLKIWITIAVLLVILAGVIIAATWDRGPTLDKNAIAYQLPGEVKNTDPESIMLPGFDTLVMNYNTHKVDIALLNPDGNDCYFRYHIVLKDSGEELYKTGLIKPGTAVTSFKVDKKLKKGKYPIVINVDTVSLKDQDKSYNGGAIEAVLEVK